MRRRGVRRAFWRRRRRCACCWQRCRGGERHACRRRGAADGYRRERDGAGEGAYAMLFLLMTMIRAGPRSGELLPQPYALDLFFAIRRGSSAEPCRQRCGSTAVRYLQTATRRVPRRRLPLLQRGRGRRPAGTRRAAQLLLLPPPPPLLLQCRRRRRGAPPLLHPRRPLLPQAPLSWAAAELLRAATPGRSRLRRPAAAARPPSGWPLLLPRAARRRLLPHWQPCRAAGQAVRPTARRSQLQPRRQTGGPCSDPCALHPWRLQPSSRPLSRQ